MPSRARNLDVRTNHTGTYFHVAMDPQTGYRGVDEGILKDCTDTVGNFKGNNDLFIDERETYWPRLDGEWIDHGTLIVGCYSMPCSQMAPQAPSPLDRYGAIDALLKNDLAWQVLSQTNPSKPDVSLPTAIAELKDLPGWLKDLPNLVKRNGDDLLAKVASGHLSWRWVIKPMMSDINKLLQFEELVNKRAQTLKRLADGKEIKRKCGLGQDDYDTGWSGVDYPFESVVTSVWGRERTHYLMKMWGQTSYKMSESMDGFHTLSRFLREHGKGTGADKRRKRMRALAKQLVLGTTSYELLAAAWEICPWSWFVDWFFHIGDVITACNNSLGLTWGSILVMRTASAEKTYEYTRVPDWVTTSGKPYGKRTTKERYVVFPVVPFSLSIPLLTQRHWSVLESLAILSLNQRRGPRR
jgi:hypothetical protein